MLLDCGVGEDSWEFLGLQGHPKGSESWIFIGRTDTEAETPILWPPHVKSWLIGNDPDAGRNWRQEEKGMTEDEMAGWHHWLNGHEFEWTPEVGDGQGGLACCDSWGHKELDTTEQLNWTELNEGRLEEEMATHSSILAWEIPWTEEAWRAAVPWGCKDSDTTLQLNNNNKGGSNAF